MAPQPAFIEIEPVRVVLTSSRPAKGLLRGDEGGGTLRHVAGGGPRHGLHCPNSPIGIADLDELVAVLAVVDHLAAGCMRARVIAGSSW